MTHTALNELNALLEGMTLPDLLEKLSADTLTAVRSDLIAAQPLTTEEQAYFDAEHDLSAAIARASETATKALRSQLAGDLNASASAFLHAAVQARKLADAQARMQSAFQATDEYAAQVEAQL